MTSSRRLQDWKGPSPGRASARFITRSSRAVPVRSGPRRRTKRLQLPSPSAAGGVLLHLVAHGPCRRWPFLPLGTFPSRQRRPPPAVVPLPSDPALLGPVLRHILVAPHEALAVCAATHRVPGAPGRVFGDPAPVAHGP